MVDVRVIGLDIAKSVFSCMAWMRAERRCCRSGSREPVCCRSSRSFRTASLGLRPVRPRHFWARELARLGHEVKLMPAQYVKPYVKRQENDMADAEAIYEAVTRPNMRFVAAKSPEQQSGMMLHKVSPD